MVMKKSLVALLVCGACVGTVHAQAFQNGSFETGTAPGGFINLPVGSTAITGWTVVGPGDVDYIGTYWTAADGARSVDLSGGSGGGVEQTFTTVAGTTYDVSFSLSGNPDCAQGVKTVNVTATPPGTTASYTHDTTGTGRPAIPWSSRQFNFTASGTTTTLRFATTDASACGPALDNVVVTARALPAAAAVPTLSEWALGLLALAMGGFALRRHRRQH